MLPMPPDIINKRQNLTILFWFLFLTRKNIVTPNKIIEKTGSDLLIVIDALCARDKGRIFKTVQLTDSGISPGSGVKNRRKEISKNTLGIEVIAIGVPTVIEYPNDDTDLIVTPKDCDILTEKLSEILARCLNIYLQPDIDPEILFQLV